MTDVRIDPVGDACLLVTFDEAIDPVINDRCIALSAAFERGRQTGIRDVVPGIHTVAIHFDPLVVNRTVLAGEVEQRLSETVSAAGGITEPLEIVVSYGGADGPDLQAVASFARCSEAEVVRLHATPLYRVYMLGFLPGFAYLGPVDPRIAMPRLDAPRVRVPAGSVGIAGRQTGIYPCDTPGGWRIVGRAEIKAFDSSSADPALFKPGRRVRFVAA